MRYEFVGWRQQSKHVELDADDTYDTPLRVPACFPDIAMTGLATEACPECFSSTLVEISTDLQRGCGRQGVAQCVYDKGLRARLAELDAPLCL